MEGYKFRSEFALRHQAIGREEGVRQSVTAMLTGRRFAGALDDLEARLQFATRETLAALVVEINEASTAAEARAAFDRLVPKA